MTAMQIIFSILGCLGAYFIGSIPFSVWIGKLATGTDLTKTGSRNPGGLNAFKTYGVKIGLPIIFLDWFKGTATIALLDHLFNHPFFAATDGSNVYHSLMCIIGPAFCIFGHNYPVWLKFQGGQGLGAFLGILLYLNPLLMSSFFVFYIVVYGLLKIPTRTTTSIVILLCIPVAFFLPIGPPWANILNDWVVGGNGFLFLTQGLLLVSINFAMYFKRIHLWLFGSDVETARLEVRKDE
jgi:glycerol-3-phosphate acyltransferase PlsY